MKVLVLSASSNICQLHPYQITHIKHNGTKFQIFDEHLLASFSIQTANQWPLSITPIESQMIKQQNSTTQTWQCNVITDDPPSLSFFFWISQMIHHLFTTSTTNDPYLQYSRPINSHAKTQSDYQCLHQNICTV